MKVNKFFIIFSITVTVFLLFSLGCQKINQETGIELKTIDSVAADMEPDQQTVISKETEGADTAGKKADETNSDMPSYLEEYEGLHITGSAIDVDIENYRLRITGAVQNVLELTFDEVKELPSVRKYYELECPGFFVDKGYWTGVKVIDLLNLAVLNDNATKIEFTSIDASYSKILELDEIKPEGFLIAYQFNDKEFSKYHGYPLRLVANGLPGSIWVKWLGKIEVLDT